MKFFDNKEEVIDIKLTQLGKRLLADGKFKPKYYEFYDNNVIYDSNYVGFSEIQNATEGRIQSDTPYLQTQHNFSACTVKIAEIVRPENVNNVEAKLPIARSSLGTDKIPQWNLQFYDGKITSIAATFTGSNELKTHIPQIDLSPKYRVFPMESGESSTNAADMARYQRQFFSDGSFLMVLDDNIIIDINEKNTPYEMENFDVEVFLLEDASEGGLTIRKLKKLNFLQKPIYIQDDVLLDTPIAPPTDFELTKDYVDYYLDIAVDSGISNSELCEAVQKLASRGIYIDTAFECPDTPSVVFPDIYFSNISDDDIKDC